MSRIPPAVRAPTRAQIERIAEQHHLALTEEEFEAIETSIDNVLPGYQRIRDLTDVHHEATGAGRTVKGRPSERDNPYNAIVRRCEIGTRDTGSLAGYDIGVKDMIAVAGVEMSCGSNLMTGYIPHRDATVVSRILEAGGTITATLNLEDLAYSASGEISANGLVRNPRAPEHLSGGSSSGSAVAVYTGEVDAAIGTDQGGSSRVPASWCGVVGIKPTYGLVPYTGIVSRDPAIDHAGVFARTVTDCARVLEAIAGDDPLDPRQRGRELDIDVDALSTDLGDWTIGVLEEGFGRDSSDEAVDETVRASLEQAADAGATIETVSIPKHVDGKAILMALSTEGSAAAVQAETIGHYSRGYYDVAFAEAFGRARRTNADDFPPTQKLSLILGTYLAEQYHGRYYASAQNLVRDLQTAYDSALADIDVLAMPTTTHTAHEIVPDLTIEDALRRAFSMTDNTSPFDASGHPAISIPCGSVDGLPVGLMLIGELGDDRTVLDVANAFEEQVADWETV